MVGIYGIPGLTPAIFTPTEVAAVYPILVTDFVYKDMGPLRADQLATEGEAYPRAQRQRPYALFTARVHPDTKATLLEGGKLTVMPMFIVANALMLKHVLTNEQFMEPSGLLIIVAPLVLPVAIELGIYPIHLGIFMVVTMEIGMITPPQGLNLFVTSEVAKMPVFDVVKADLPWLGILVPFLIPVTYVPWISLAIPHAVSGPETIVR